jgi:ADP-heptose:LPS heptosyltransferase
LGARRYPRPVLTGRYRYSRWRWRLLACALDGLGFALMAVFRLLRPRPVVTQPRRILLVQLDHLGDAVLTTPMIPWLRTAYPEARIDVLASPSNRAVFEADRDVGVVHVAERNWFERRPAAFARGTAVWRLGRMLRRVRYDLGIDVRGDVLSVLVLALAGIPRRLGWAMGGGGFLLTDVARWVPGRHEVPSRLALLERLGLASEAPPRVAVRVPARDRATVARWLRAAWPEDEIAKPRRAAVPSAVAVSERGRRGSLARHKAAEPRQRADAEALHAGRFGDEAPLLVAHLGAGTAAKRWPLRHWRALLTRFLDDGWRVVVIGGPAEAGIRLDLAPHASLRDWTGRLSVTEVTALLERADFFIGADSGPAHLAACARVPSLVLFSGTNRVRQWRPWSRRSLVLRHRVPCQPCHRKRCPLADHPCLSGLRPERVYHAARRWWARLHRDEAPHAPL